MITDRQKLSGFGNNADACMINVIDNPEQIAHEFNILCRSFEISGQTAKRIFLREAAPNIPSDTRDRIERRLDELHDRGWNPNGIKHQPLPHPESVAA